MVGSKSVSVEVLRPSDLPQRDRDAWAAMRVNESRFSNPLLSFQFAEAVGAVRADSHVAIYRRAGQAVGFLAHHRTASGLARPIGAPFSDYHALISQPDPGFTGRDALTMAGLRCFRYSGLIDPWGLFPAPIATATAYRIEAPDSAREVLAGLRERSPSSVKTWLKEGRRLERVGSVLFTASNNSPEDLETVFNLKRARFLATGVHDVLSVAWVRSLMANLHERSQSSFRGVLSTLHVDDALMAGNFGVRDGDAFHSWIISHDPAWARYSPGSLLQLRNLEAMPSVGLRTWDIGTGEGLSKERLATHTTEVVVGVVAKGPIRPWDAAAVSGSNSLLTRLARRLEQIAAVEPTLLGRLCGLGALALATRKRLGPPSR